MLGSLALPTNNANRGLNTLPVNQYDFRNANDNRRYIEISATFEADPPPERIPVLPITINYPTAEYSSFYSYDRSKSLRMATLGLESYTVVHSATFQEQNRAPVAICSDYIQALMNTRYVALLPNDGGQGLYTSTSVTIVGELPPVFSFTIGLIDLSDATNVRVYPLNADGPPDPTIPGNPPKWVAQHVRAVNIRLYITFTFEPNFVPVYGAPNRSDAPTRHAMQQANQQRRAQDLIQIYLGQANPQDLPGLIHDEKGASDDDDQIQIPEPPLPTVEAADAVDESQGLAGPGMSSSAGEGGELPSSAGGAGQFPATGGMVRGSGGGGRRGGGARGGGGGEGPPLPPGPGGGLPSIIKAGLPDITGEKVPGMQGPASANQAGQSAPDPINERFQRAGVPPPTGDAPVNRAQADVLAEDTRSMAPMGPETVAGGAANVAAGHMRAIAHAHDPAVIQGAAQAAERAEIAQMEGRGVDTDADPMIEEIIEGAVGRGGVGAARSGDARMTPATEAATEDMYSDDDPGSPPFEREEPYQPPPEVVAGLRAQRQEPAAAAAAAPLPPSPPPHAPMDTSMGGAQILQEVQMAAAQQGGGEAAALLGSAETQNLQSAEANPQVAGPELAPQGVAPPLSAMHTQLLGGGGRGGGRAPTRRGGRFAPPPELARRSTHAAQATPQTLPPPIAVPPLRPVQDRRREDREVVREERLGLEQDVGQEGHQRRKSQSAKRRSQSQRSRIQALRTGQ